MNKRVKEMWVAALRSGDYLPNSGGAMYVYEYNNFEGKPKWHYCPLGVLNNLRILEIQSDPGTSMNMKPMHQWDGSVLPKDTRDWAELPACPKVKIYFDEVTISGLHDYGVPFTTIADLIEEQL